MEEQSSSSNLQSSKMQLLESLRISLKRRPQMIELIMSMRKCIKKKNVVIKKLKQCLKEKNVRTTSINASSQNNVFELNIPHSSENETPTSDNDNQSLKNTKSTQTPKVKTSDTATQMETMKTKKCEESLEAGWNLHDGSGEMSLAEQVKEVAQTALQQTGMVYVESAGMYYDYKTGYYYNSELGLYYHTDTNCYYYYSDEKQSFVFHSYPDSSIENPGLVAHNKKKARKHKAVQLKEDVMENLTKNLSQENEDSHLRLKQRKISKVKESKNKKPFKAKIDENGDQSIENNGEKCDVMELEDKEQNSEDTQDTSKKDNKASRDLEDGECSDSADEDSGSDNECSSNASTSTLTDDENVAKHHPPCMRVIVRETSLPKLKIGNLFLITKDGGTIGREGEQHAIVLKDHNVSRNHLDIQYDLARQTYTAVDLGSKNGTILNGIRMSESQVVSKRVDVVHGSTIHIGETKLLCHVHPGNDTCGHCEPGLVMTLEEREKKVAYTRTCSVQRQHQLELARLKNKYAPKVLSIEETAYNDRAQARRDAVGSSHEAEKTQTTDLDTFIAPENKGFRLLEKMGWSKGEGLGKDSQGEIEPVPLISNEGKAGLGTPGASNVPPLVPTRTTKNTLGPATLRLATRTKMLQPPAKAFSQDNGEESE
ncbi:angiogenic factor with G patch and FHA domains 1 isoform X1 [Bombyx mori]|uniref:Angiogenic factor with G patch and FHA domains 1 n=1 Tax=Bombyx mori TaxID=7091 RepID=A0A8R1WLQ5_BOMMO|nr:angiogenic factor with G patch and FHA domains 1 isoform X1 [Bombyx mori]